MLGPVPRSTAQQGAYRLLRVALRDGAFPPGTPLTNRELATGLGVSVTPVREAIGRLASEGALELTSGGTAIVPTLDWPVVDQLLWLGRMIGARLIVDAAARLDESILADMAAVAKAVDALRPPFDATVAQLVRQFYAQLFAVSALGELAAIIDRLWVRIGPLHAVLNPSFYETEETRHYHDVLDALVAGDGAAAAEAFARFMDRMAAFLEAALIDG